MPDLENTRLGVDRIPDQEPASRPGSAVSAATADEPASRSPLRRIDPDRKARILSATVAVLAEHGVAATTHRRVAAQAGVPLATLTYHFAGLADLRAQGFASYTAAQSRRFTAVFEHVTTRRQLVEALVDVVAGEPGKGLAVVGFELRLAALRDPSLRSVMRGGPTPAGRCSSRSPTRTTPRTSTRCWRV
jgi:AcrR family transcriptional regulator